LVYYGVSAEAMELGKTGKGKIISSCDLALVAI
jgi:hypothetical protein